MRVSGFIIALNDNCADELKTISRNLWRSLSYDLCLIFHKILKLITYTQGQTSCFGLIQLQKTRIA